MLVKALCDGGVLVSDFEHGNCDALDKLTTGVVTAAVTGKTEGLLRFAERADDAIDDDTGMGEVAENEVRDGFGIGSVDNDAGFGTVSERAFGVGLKLVNLSAAQF
jgi:hypothetical protein